ncbi:hypothetical protein DPMN_187231 [Dreissena polymorpha]|uniref:Uncharacterized protein n=1 Tax=Dreissena polymorpha TaxID=45954 RepID=A0A9D4DQ59_DREPO|nr:hypothetical protein DPMN_187231 [Dreissena polymorpha]
MASFTVFPQLWDKSFSKSSSFSLLGQQLERARREARVTRRKFLTGRLLHCYVRCHLHDAAVLSAAVYRREFAGPDLPEVPSAEKREQWDSGITILEVIWRTWGCWAGDCSPKNIEVVALERDPGAAVLSALNALGKPSRG